MADVPAGSFASVTSTPPAFDPLRYWARLDPERVAVIERTPARRWSYESLSVRADRWVAWLAANRVARGAHVAVLARNRADHVALLHACLRSGTVLVPLNWRLAGVELARVLAHCRPAVFLVERDLQDLVRAAGVHPGQWIDLDDAAAALPPASAAPDQPSSFGSEEDPWLLLYTSGSTGEAKGAILSRRQQFWNAMVTAAGWELSSRDRALVATPFFHTAGWNVFATPLWYAGGGIVLLPSFDPAEFLQALEDEACTLAFGVPALYQALLGQPRWGRPLPALRHLVTGGAPCPPSLHRAVRAAGYAFRTAYGLTECGPNCFVTTDDVAAADPESVGWPLPFLETRIVDKAGGERRDGEIGELWLRGPQLFAGYHDAPAATAAAFAPGGWLRTGDLARRDAAGNHTICGRRGEMYISGGANVFPGEVEAALLDHAGVAEAAVIGVPDERWGEAGVAYIVLHAGASASGEEVRDFARTRIAGYKVPRAVMLMESLPRLGSGKVDRRTLATLAADTLPAAGRETLPEGAAY